MEAPVPVADDGEREAEGAEALECLDDAGQRLELHHADVLVGRQRRAERIVEDAHAVLSQRPCTRDMARQNRAQHHEEGHHGGTVQSQQPRLGWSGSVTR